MAIVCSMWFLVLPSLPSVHAQGASPVSIQTSFQSGVPVAGDFQVGPTRFQLELAPGEEQVVILEVTNRSGKREGYSFVAEDFSAGTNEGEPTRLYGGDDGPYPARGWILPVENNIVLDHGERAFVPIRVRVSRDAEPGDHYAALLVQRDLEVTVTADKGFNVLSRVGALFLITVKGDVVQNASLTELRSRWPVFWSYPVLLSLSAENRGTVHMQPLGAIEIRNLFGFLVDEIPLTDWIILRNSERTRGIAWKPRFALGRYTARTDFTVFGQPTAPLEASFWVFPALPVLASLFVIFLVSFIVQFFFSRFEIRRR